MVGGLAAPASATGEGNVQIRGVALFGGDPSCEFGLYMQPPDSGWGLHGCLNLISYEGSQTPSGAYRETGTEQFEGDIVFVDDAGNVQVMGSGTFDTEYGLTSKWEGEPFASFQYHGRCQHPITSGTGDFSGATGRVDFKDSIEDGVATSFPYKGHIKLANS